MMGQDLVHERIQRDIFNFIHDNNDYLEENISSVYSHQHIKLKSNPMTNLPEAS
jgi:hypothetical protein